MAKNNGFTLIELIIVVATISLFVGISVAYYNNFSENKKLESEARKFANVLNLAKSKASSGESYSNCNNFTGYRISVNADNYTLNFCCNNSCTTQIMASDLPDDIEFSSGTGNITFKPIGGETNLTSDKLIVLRDDSLNRNINITVSTFGNITLNE